MDKTWSEAIPAAVVHSIPRRTEARPQTYKTCLQLPVCGYLWAIAIAAARLCLGGLEAGEPLIAGWQVDRDEPV